MVHVYLEQTVCLVEALKRIANFSIGTLLLTQFNFFAEALWYLNIDNFKTGDCIVLL